MLCDHCGYCCQETEMLLTENDIRRIQKLGFSKDFFVRVDGKLLKLKNINGHCVFWDPLKKRCTIYPYRPIGCRVYPVIYDISKRKCIIDKECHLWHTVSKKEFQKKCRILKKTLKEIGII
ncbi:MAG: YkgJ family cysteine cluster protein [Candidatus Odinarchaeota archaeon]|nr:YkgJ family cysteine cluster protein [Candidatus Odinarchaeota archaeon]